MPSSAIRDIKARERERAQAKFRKEQDEQAKALGYKSHEDMMAKLQARGRNPKPTAPKERRPDADSEDGSEPTSGGSRQERRLMRRIEELTEQLKRSNKERAHAEKKARRLEQDLASKHAESELKLTAVRAGVQDVDYAISLLQRKLQGRSARELESFDEDKFFREELRKTHPYLYGVVEQEATTGADENVIADAPPPGEKPAAPKGNGHAKDARELTPDQYHGRLKELGLGNPQSGF